jgi:hypothetical protein
VRWINISSRLTAAGKPLDAELFTYMVNNINYCYAWQQPNRNKVINGSFELIGNDASTFAIGWTPTTYPSGGAITMTTVSAHGAYAVNMDKGAATGAALLESGYIPCCTGITYTGKHIIKASNTAMQYKTQIAFYNSNLTYTTMTSAVTSSSINASYTNISYTFTGLAMGFLKIRFLLSTKDTKIGNITIDNVRLIE